MNFDDESRVMHKYYKGLREIDVSSPSEYVAWTDMQLCFRKRDEEALDDRMAEMMLMFVRLYGRAFKVFDHVRPLSLGGDCLKTAKYGVETKMNYISGVKDKDTIMAMLHFLIGIDSADTLYNRFLSRIRFDDLTDEQVKGECPALMEALIPVQEELKEFLRIVEEEGRYVSIRQVY